MPNANVPLEIVSRKKDPNKRSKLKVQQVKETEDNDDKQNANNWTQQIVETPQNGQLFMTRWDDFLGNYGLRNTS